MKSYTSILEETLEEELFMSNLNTLRIETVSYTHLDVYKRQVMYSTRLIV